MTLSYCPQIMDDRWETEVIEYGAINITGFRIVDVNRRYVKDILEGWRKFDPTISQGVGKESLSVSYCTYLIKLNYSLNRVTVFVGHPIRPKLP